jgi:DNA-binding response OmpR family regulator
MTAEPPSKPRNPAPPPSLFSRRIALVVDDELGILDLVRGLLEDDGWVVYTAPTGQQAIRYARQAPALHLLITDIALPDMDGIEVALTILVDRPQVPIVYMTGDHNRSGIGLGRDLYLRKPFSEAEFEAAVRKAMSHRAGTA